MFEYRQTKCLVEMKVAIREFAEIKREADKSYEVRVGNPHTCHHYALLQPLTRARSYCHHRSPPSLPISSAIRSAWLATYLLPQRHRHLRRRVAVVWRVTMVVVCAGSW